MVLRRPRARATERHGYQFLALRPWEEAQWTKAVSTTTIIVIVIVINDNMRSRGFPVILISTYADISHDMTSTIVRRICLTEIDLCKDVSDISHDMTSTNEKLNPLSRLL